MASVNWKTNRGEIWENEFRENARRVAEEEAEANSKRQNSQRDVHETLQTSADHNGQRQLIVR